MLYRIISASLLAIALAISPALAGSGTLAVTPGSGATLRVGTDGSTNLFGNGAICDGAACALLASVNAAGTPGTNGLAIQGLTGGVPVPISAASLPLPSGASTAAGLTTINTTLGSPFQAGGSIGNTTFAATQATAASLNATVVGTGTFAVQAAATLNAETTKVIGTVRNLGNAGAITDFAGQNASSPANAWLIGGQFNTSPTTITSGNVSPFQLDNAGNLLVNVKAGGASGGTSAADATPWVAGTTAQTAIGCEFTTSGATALASAHFGTVGCTAARGIFTDKSSVDGTALGAVVSNLGTLASGTPSAENVNMFMVGCVTTVCNANIANNADSISPTTNVASPVANYNFLFDGTNWDRIRGTSGGHLITEGAGTAGSAAGGVSTIQGVASMTPILANPGTAANWGVGATGSAPPANAGYLGANASGATGGQMRGLINCDNHIFKHITTATDTLAVQGVASQTIYICGQRSRAAGVATWYLENTASTNANCSSTLTQITGVATEAANTGEVNNNPIWGGLKNTSGNGLCINSTGTGGVDIDIWYTQL